MKEVFESLVNKHYKIEQDSDKLLFRDKGEDMLVYEDDKPASPANIEMKLREKYADLYRTAKPGLGTSRTNGSSVAVVREGASSLEYLQAGIGELRKM